MIKHTLRAAVVAASAAALAGCLDDNPVEPVRDCTLNATPSVSIPGDTVRQANGLRLIEVAAGDGPQVQSGSTTTVCYVGFFPNGNVFDLGSFRFVPSDGDVIPGFIAGVVGMREGGVRRLVIPPSLGYGSEPVRDRNGNIVIPANSTLVFDVGVLQVR